MENQTPNPPDSTHAPNPATIASIPTADTAFGQAIWLMMNMPQYRHVFLSDLEWMVLPPIVLNQYRIFNAGGRVVGFAAWAYVSAEVEARLLEPNPRLAPADWKSGDRLWLINLFTPFGQAEVILEELRATGLAGKSFKMHQRAADGRADVVEIGADSQMHGKVLDE